MREPAQSGRRLSKRYKNPTLIEIYIECYLTPSTLTAARLFDVVPAVKAKGFTDVEMLGNFQLGPGEAMVQPRVRCWSEGRKKLIQMSEDTLIVNLVGGYPGWATFTELLETAVNAVTGAAGGVAFASMNLNTIDRFSVPVEGYVFDRYVSCGGKIVPDWYRDSREALDITLGKGLLQDDARNRQINVKVLKRESVLIEFRVGLHNLIGGERKWKDVLEMLHDESNEIFESLITDTTRSEIMGGLIT